MPPGAFCLCVQLGGRRALCVVCLGRALPIHQMADSGRQWPTDGRQLANRVSGCRGQHTEIQDFPQPRISSLLHNGPFDKLSHVDMNLDAMLHLELQGHVFNTSVWSWRALTRLDILLGSR